MAADDPVPGTVVVGLFGPARALAGRRDLRLAVALPTTVERVVRAIGEAAPSLRPLLPDCAIAIDDRLVGRGDAVTEGARVDVLPPVSGGT